jgi:uncharacterized membrane protein YbaN (DUF454 family)
MPAHRSALRTAVGLLLVLLGLIGMLLPIMPGLPLVIVGVAMIGLDHPIIRPFVSRLKRWRQPR